MRKEKLGFAAEKKEIMAYPTFNLRDIGHGFTTTLLGPENGNTSLDFQTRTVAEHNVTKALSLLEKGFSSRVHMLPAYGAKIHIALPGDCGTLVKADAIFTDFSGVALTMCSAESVPVVVATDPAYIIGLINVSRESLRKKIVEKCIEKITHSKVTPDGIRIAIGPWKCRICAGNNNIVGAVHDRLISAGVLDQNIWFDEKACTHCSSLADGKTKSGRPLFPWIKMAPRMVGEMDSRFLVMVGM